MYNQMPLADGPPRTSVPTGNQISMTFTSIRLSCRRGGAATFGCNGGDLLANNGLLLPLIINYRLFAETYIMLE